MRKRSKYRPKGVRLDNMTYVQAGMKTIASLPGIGVQLLTKNHAALDELMMGRGNSEHVDILIGAFNMAECFAMMDESLGADWLEEIHQGQDALYEMGTRGVSGKRFIFRGPELEAVKKVLEIHDLQLEQATVKQMEEALRVVEEFIRCGKVRKIKRLEAA